MKRAPARGLRGHVAAIVALTLYVAAESRAAEGGYSNYLPGTYGDFGMALEPAGTLTLRNDVYFHNADVTRSLRAGRLEGDHFFLSFAMDW